MSKYVKIAWAYNIIIKLKIQRRRWKQTWGPFLESAGNFSNPKSIIQIEI